MNTKFSIKNFRVFDENGINLELKPLTVLTGCNSAGKSTIVKAMLILKHFFLQIKNAYDSKAPIDLFSYKIDIATEELKSLGNFANAINRNSDSKEVTFEYTFYSLMLSKEVNVSLTFTVDDNDELKNGILQKIILKLDNNEFYSACRKESGFTCNLNAIKNECVDFLEIEYLIHGYCSLYGEYNYDPIRSKTDEEYKELLKEAKSEIKKFDKNRSKDILKFVYSSQIPNQNIIRRYNLNQSVFEWTRENDSYFRIPIIEELDKVGKEGILSLITQDLLTEKDTEDMRFAYEKIANDFISSSTSSFSCYFKELEKEFLKAVKYHDFNFGGVPRIYDFKISQDYSSMNPERWESGNLFEEEPDINREEKKNEEINLWKNKHVDFPMLYEIVMRWNKRFLDDKEEEQEYYRFDPEIMPAGGYKHYAYSALGAFLENIVNEVLNPEAWVGLAYTSSSRIAANPYYSLSDNSNFSIALKKYFEARRVFQEKKLNEKYDFEIGSYINKWIRELKIGESISFHIIQDLEIVSPRLHKNPDDKGCFLTDVGFGVTQLLSVLIPVETLMLSRFIDANSYKGINRIEGIMDLMKMYDNWTKNELKISSFLFNTVAIEEPEIHLHPSYQSKLAEMFVDAYNKCGIHFVIETHSEYLVRKLQVMVADKESVLTSDKVSLNYVGENESEVSANRKIEILEDGALSDPFGSGFYDEADDLAIQLFRNKPILS